MKTFNNQLGLTAFWEQGPNGGPALKAYKCPAGKLTIGYGDTMPGGKTVTPDMTCTPEQAMGWLYTCLTDIEDTLTVVHYITESGSQKDAIIDYAYNVGMNGFPTLLKKLKAGDIEGASLEFLDGIYTGKTPLLGLLLRRISEYNTFVNGTYIAYEKGDPITQDLKDKLLAKNSKNQAAGDMINRLTLIS